MADASLTMLMAVIGAVAIVAKIARIRGWSVCRLCVAGWIGVANVAYWQIAGAPIIPIEIPFAAAGVLWILDRVFPINAGV